jgi:predicted nucleic acid-binding protein
MMRTFVDACVLIAAVQGKDSVAERAFEIIDDPNREFVVSDFLRLEVLPKPTFHRQVEQVEAYEEFFKRAGSYIEPNRKISSDAVSLACKYDLQPVDALHISTAANSGVEEFITLEKPGKPMTRVQEIKVISICKT